MPLNGHTENTGAILPAQHIRKLVEQGHILVPGCGKELFRDPDLLKPRLQPASLDLRLDTRIWRVRASFLPNPQKPVADLIARLASHEMNLNAGAVLEPGSVYIAELQESLALPAHLHARASAKSSVGRLNLFTRLITEHGPAFDAVPARYHGALYCEIAPCAFPVLARRGDCLNSLRIFNGDPTPVAETTLRVDLSGADTDGLIGYRAKKHTDIVDLSATATAPPARFWDPLPAEPSRQLVLDPDAFYILVSRPGVRLGADVAGELEPFAAEMGEFRVHYAGFFDPGFGIDAPGGARAVLEVRSHEVPFVLEDGQAVGRLVASPLAEETEMPYARAARDGAGYDRQALTLSRHFADFAATL
ncbi:MAG: 2'-deoxycytidine 5'-triphosphate deaminase [Alphaproteobacteria bacterium]|nr:2'-deoxycytidine 5'-triphosphate deaminase [Alphaproteobacteria bacterium]MDA7987485.1 2'-deoxycytidine 5'-triphosphate deaminase [Alphaproteobacteria bacterium]